MIDLEEDNYKIKIYTVGEYSDMDEVLNNFESIKTGASEVTYLDSHNGEYVISVN